MAYDKVNWADYPNTDTPIMADLLNQMDDQIAVNTSDLDGIKAGTIKTGVAKKIGTTTVGKSSIPIYISNGVPTECSLATEVKNKEELVSNKAVFEALKNGTVARIGVDTVGAPNRPVYLKNGYPYATATNIGADNRPVYYKEGVVTASSKTVGGPSRPVYMKDGVITECPIKRSAIFGIQNITITGSITLASDESKVTAKLSSVKAFDKTGTFVAGVTGIRFSNTHHEIICSDFNAYVGTDGKIKADITIPTHSETRGAKTDITVNVAILTDDTMNSIN